MPLTDLSCVLGALGVPERRKVVQLIQLRITNTDHDEIVKLMIGG